MTAAPATIWSLWLPITALACTGVIGFFYLMYRMTAGHWPGQRLSETSEGLPRGVFVLHGRVSRIRRKQERFSHNGWIETQDYTLFFIDDMEALAIGTPNICDGHEVTVLAEKLRDDLVDAPVIYNLTTQTKHVEPTDALGSVVIPMWILSAVAIWASVKVTMFAWQCAQ